MEPPPRPMTPEPDVQCPGCGEARLIEWDPVLRRWECRVCGWHWVAGARHDVVTMGRVADKVTSVNSRTPH